MQYFTNNILCFPQKNKDGSVSSMECQRTYSWLEVSTCSKPKILQALERTENRTLRGCLRACALIKSVASYVKMYLIKIRSL